MYIVVLIAMLVVLAAIAQEDLSAGYTLTPSELA